MMEIEFTKKTPKRVLRKNISTKKPTNTRPDTNPYKRKMNQMPNKFFENTFHNPLKQLKAKNSQSNFYHLSNPEKASILLQGVVGTEPQKIAVSINRDKRSIQNFLKEKDSPNVFESKNSKKGRWSKGTGKLTQNHKSYIYKWINDGTIRSSRDTYLRLNRIKKLPRISYHPVRLYLKKVGQFVKPTLKTEVTEVNKRKRLQYCIRRQNFNFKRTMFTDESSFQLNANNQKVFKLKGSKTPLKSKLNPNIKIMVWGGVSYLGKTSLTIIQGKLGGDEYHKLLKRKRPEIKSIFSKYKIWYWQHDSAPAHRSLKVKRYIKNWLTKSCLPHPPQSPDLNPIELVWTRMKREVESQHPKNKAELLEAIIRVGKKLIWFI